MKNLKFLIINLRREYSLNLGWYWTHESGKKYFHGRDSPAAAAGRLGTVPAVFVQEQVVGTGRGNSSWERRGEGIDSYFNDSKGVSIRCYCQKVIIRIVKLST